VSFGRLPLRTAIVRETQLEYNAMLVGVFQVLEAKRQELDAGRIGIEALRDYWIARTELERAVGAPLERAQPAADATQDAPATAAPALDAPSQPTEPEHVHHNE